MRIPGFNKKPTTRELPPAYSPVAEVQKRRPLARLLDIFSRSNAPIQGDASTPAYSLQTPTLSNFRTDMTQGAAPLLAHTAVDNVQVDEAAYTEAQRLVMAKHITKMEEPFICELILMSLSSALKGTSQHLSNDDVAEALVGGLHEAGYFDAICRIAARDQSAATLLHRTSLLGTPFEQTEQRATRLMLEGVFSETPRLNSTQKKRLPLSQEICRAFNPPASATQAQFEKMVPYVAANLSQQDEEDLLAYVRSPEGKRTFEESQKGAAERMALMKTPAVSAVVQQRLLPIILEAVLQDRF